MKFEAALKAARPLIVFFLIPLLSCSKDQLPKYTELKELRVLALIANPPEVDAGASTTITPVISDITESSSLTYEALGCIDPGVSAGAEPTCSGNPTAVTLQTGTLNTGDMAANRSFTGSAVSFTVNLPAAGVIFSQRSAQDQFNGVSYLVTYQIRNTTGTTVQSFKRIVVSTRGAAEKNQNPNLTDVLNSGIAFTPALPAGQLINLTTSPAAPTAQTYTVQNSDGTTTTRTEEILTTWFITDGEMTFYRTTQGDQNEWKSPAATPMGRDVFIIAVTRDSRGGIAYVKKCFGTCP